MLTANRIVTEQRCGNGWIAITIFTTYYSFTIAYPTV